MKPTRASRALQILTTFQSGRKYGAGDLAKMLNVSKRTLLRDRKELSKIGIRCHYNWENRSYEMDSKSFLPRLNLTLKEAEGLLLLLHKVRNHLHFPFKNSALLEALKTENLLSAAIKRHCTAVLQNISVKPEPQIQMDLLDETFSVLQEKERRKALD